MSRRPRDLPSAPAPQRVVVFTDLHVSAATLDRALVVLSRVRALAVDRSAPVVCLGDFWDLRGVLPVRQVDALLDEFERWRDAGVQATFVPGNHDQVSRNGRVHGVRFFGAFPNITVATEPIADHNAGIAFLPWREEPEEQAAQFLGLTHGGEHPPLTIFAHAEVSGALANSGHPAVGRVSVGQIEAVSRACYLGHYHKRQKLGAHTWYIGSPFEQNFGERDQPHGIAVVDLAGGPEPEWIDWHDFPKHHRLEFAGVPIDVSRVRPGDVVEVRAAPAAIGGAALAAQLARIPEGTDVRPLPTRVEENPEAPAFAVGVVEAVSKYVDHDVDMADTVGADITAGGGVGGEELKTLGLSFLAEVGERSSPPLGPSARLTSLRVRDFCAVRGDHALSVDGLRLGDALAGFGPSTQTLIRGPVGSGKTSVLDALTWALFGTTSPRKAGVHGATLKADEVVNDRADSCSVEVAVEVAAGGALKHPAVFRIVRSKKRGQGARVDIGIESPRAGEDGLRDVNEALAVLGPDGISDQQRLIERIVGLDLALWRACVYTGQGSVGNFVTDADKARKALFSSAMPGLSACPAAQSLARREAASAEGAATMARSLAVKERAAADALRNFDWQTQIERWEADRQAAISACRSTVAESDTAIAHCDKHLADEPGWTESKSKHEAHLARVTEQLIRARESGSAAPLQQQLGAARAERAAADRALNDAKQSLRKVMADIQAGKLACPMCGRPFDEVAREQHVSDLEKAVEIKTSDLRTHDTRLSDLTIKLGELMKVGTAESAALDTQVAESRAAIQKCGEALAVFGRLRANKEAAQRRRQDSLAEIARREAAENPGVAARRDADRKVAEHSARAEAAEAEAASADRRAGACRYWDVGFGPKGVPVLVLRTALAELEAAANGYLARLLRGTVFCRLSLAEEDLEIQWFEFDPVTREARERTYEALSGGQRRCAELSFSPFALSDVIFPRRGCRVLFLAIDELTAHLGAEEKPEVCGILRAMVDRDVVVVDHDPTVQGEFDAVIEVRRSSDRWEMVRTS